MSFLRLDDTLTSPSSSDHQDRKRFSIRLSAALVGKKLKSASVITCTLVPLRCKKARLAAALCRTSTISHGASHRARRRSGLGAGTGYLQLAMEAGCASTPLPRSGISLFHPVELTPSNHLVAAQAPSQLSLWTSFAVSQGRSAVPREDSYSSRHLKDSNSLPAPGFVLSRHVATDRWFHGHG